MDIASLPTDGAPPAATTTAFFAAKLFGPDGHHDINAVLGTRNGIAGKAFQPTDHAETIMAPKPCLLTVDDENSVLFTAVERHSEII